MAEKRNKHLEAIKFNREKAELTILDQLSIPEKRRYIRLNNAQEGYNAIAKMFVRGAPAIGMVCVLSVAIDMKNTEFTDKSSLRGFVATQARMVCKSRPTAVNLQHLADWLIQTTNDATEELDDLNDIKDSILTSCEDLFLRDYEDNLALGGHGARHVLSACGAARLGTRVNVLTHCNTGSLATVGYGTALGVVRALNDQDKLECCYYTETRPYLQGARLTAYEVREDHIPGCLIPDSAAAHLMKSRDIHCVIVGADRITANGDVANKIGTYHIAIAAKHHQVPFYVAAPVSTIDWKLRSGRDITIEERDATEMICYKDRRIAPDGTVCWNPAFDVTPAELVTGGIVSQYGVHRPADLERDLASHVAGRARDSQR